MFLLNVCLVVMTVLYSSCHCHSWFLAGQLYFVVVVVVVVVAVIVGLVGVIVVHLDIQESVFVHCC